MSPAELDEVVQKGHKDGLEIFLHSEGYQINETHPDHAVTRYSGHDEAIVTLVSTQGPPIQYYLNLGCSAIMHFATGGRL
jgi:hypothetical protein